MHDTVAVEIPKHLEPALRGLLERESASLEADAARIGTTRRAPRVPRVFPVPKALRDDAAAARIDPSALPGLMAAVEGNAELARCWVKYATTMLPGGWRPYAPDGDFTLYMDDLLAAIQLDDRAAEGRSVEEAKCSEEDARPISEWRSECAALEAECRDHEGEIARIEETLQVARGDLRRVQAGVAVARAAIARRTPNRRRP